MSSIAHLLIFFNPCTEETPPGTRMPKHRGKQTTLILSRQEEACFQFRTSETPDSTGHCRLWVLGDLLRFRVHIKYLQFFSGKLMQRVSSCSRLQFNHFTLAYLGFQSLQFLRCPYSFLGHFRSLAHYHEIRKLPAAGSGSDSPPNRHFG